MEKPKEYHPKYQRYVVGIEGSGMIALFRTLGLTAVGYLMAHATEFKRKNTSIPVRVAYLVPIMTAAYGWNLFFEKDGVLASLRNNAKEVAHQSALGNKIE